MKNVVFSVVSFVAFHAHAQIEKNLGDFTQLRTTNRIEVELIPSSESKIVLNEKDEKVVNLVNKNGRLSVKNNIKELVSDTDYKIVVKVYYKTLNVIDAESGSYVFSDKLLETNSLKLSSNSGSKLNFKLNVKNIEAKAFGGAIIKLEGNADTGVLISNAGGYIDASKLLFKTVDATVNAGGKIDVKASDTVNATTRAGGNINIYGQPKTVTEKTTAGGNINRVK